MRIKRIILSIAILLTILVVMFYYNKQQNERTDYINAVLVKHHLKYEDLHLSSPVLNTGSGEEPDGFNDMVDAIIDSIEKLPINQNH